MDSPLHKESEKICYWKAKTSSFNFLTQRKLIVVFDLKLYYLSSE